MNNTALARSPDVVDCMRVVASKYSNVVGYQTSFEGRQSVCTGRRLNVQGRTRVSRFFACFKSTIVI